MEVARPQGLMYQLMGTGGSYFHITRTFIGRRRGSLIRLYNYRLFAGNLTEEILYQNR